MGITSTTIPLQINEVNKALRTALWNGLGTYYFPSETDYLLWSRLEVRGMMPGDRTTLHQLWIGYLNWPYDELGDWACVKNTLKDYFFSCQWFEVLDLIEFVGAMTQERVGTRKKAPPLHPFVQYCNDTLAHHNSAYRFVGGLIAPISADHEIAAVEDAIAAGARSRGLMPIQHHIQRALQCLADRQSPDYANSMKEAISAVEALCKLIAGLPDAGTSLECYSEGGHCQATCVAEDRPAQSVQLHL